MTNSVNHIPVRSINDDLTIGPGIRITLNFSLAIANPEDNTEQQFIEDNFGDQPVTFAFGDGSMLPGFENSLKGMKPGQRGQFVLRASEAFGKINEDNIHEFPRRHFENGLELAQGLVIEFSNSEGNTQPGVVKSYTDEMVVIDFNHPLAGKDIEFKVAIADITTDN